MLGSGWGGVVGRAAKAGIIKLESHNQTATWEDILNFLQQPKCKSKSKYLFWGKSNSMGIYGRCHVMTPERLPNGGELCRTHGPRQIRCFFGE